MPRQDRIAEILAIAKRKSASSSYDLERLRDTWQTKFKSLKEVDDLLPARIVTIIEVFARSWVQILIDHGAPYVERAAKLKAEMKYDFAIARSLEGRSISLGQLLSHSISLSSVESIASVFDTLLGKKLFQVIASTRSRLSIEHDGDAAVPMISDVQGLQHSIARLFEVRHILVHEFPRNRPFDSDEIEEFFNASIRFIDTLGEELSQQLHGLWPITQQEMNKAAVESWETAKAELEALCQDIAQKSGTTTIFEVQRDWELFGHAEADRQAEEEVGSGGTMRPLIYYSNLETITRARIDELRNWMTRGE
jgi:hypothetical protein